MNALVCAGCKMPIPPGSKFLAVFATSTTFRLEVGCEHVAVENVEGATAVFGSGGCFGDFLSAWLVGLNCQHRQDEKGLDGISLVRPDLPSAEEVYGILSRPTPDLEADVDDGDTRGLVIADDEEA